MKLSVKSKHGRASTRDLFAKLRKGVTALAEARQGTRALRTYAVEFKSAPVIKSDIGL